MEMRDIAIYGAGGFGREVACLINRINGQEPTWNLIGFFDDGKQKGEMISHFGPCLGGADELNAWGDKLSVAIAIGNPITVRMIAERITNPLVSFPNLIHPDFVISDPDTFTIGKGNIVQCGCTVSVDVTLGDFNVLNGTVCIGHDAHIGSFNTLMPTTRISGEVKIGDCCFFGVGSIVLQQINVGDGVRLGAGSVLMTKPKSGMLYLGVPAKKTEF